ncbi:hypothetical protein DXG01_002380 [Tephrocybe rancida]|nr:hypothetical protein DXG01_002380 [Tephrocybe rancida]
MSTQDSANGASSRALTPVLRKKTSSRDEKHHYHAGRYKIGVMFKTKVTASKLFGHASVQCSRLADDHAETFQVHKDPEPQTPAHPYMKVRLEEETSTKSVEGSSRSAAAPKRDVSWKALCEVVDEAQAGAFMPDTSVGP